MMTQTLLPQATRLEKALSLTFAKNLEIPIEIHTSWQADHCPAHLLPYLAWAVGVEEWDEEWAEETKRRVIKASIEVHKQKGTIASIRRVLASTGINHIEVVEGKALKQENPAQSRHWAEYKININQPITVKEAEQVRRLLTATVPARCRLLVFNFERAGFRWNGEINFDGKHTFGEV